MPAVNNLRALMPATVVKKLALVTLFCARARRFALVLLPFHAALLRPAAKSIPNRTATLRSAPPNGPSLLRRRFASVELDATVAAFGRETSESSSSLTTTCMRSPAASDRAS